MGDHRADITMKLVMHGLTFERSMWINWTPEPDTGCDRRVTECFADWAEKAMAKWHDEVYEDQREAREKAEAEAERREYERLKAKFDLK